MVFGCRRCGYIVVASRDGKEAWEARMCRICHDELLNALKAHQESKNVRDKDCLDRYLA